MMLSAISHAENELLGRQIISMSVNTEIWNEKNISKLISKINELLS